MPPPLSRLPPPKKKIHIINERSNTTCHSYSTSNEFFPSHTRSLALIHSLSTRTHTLSLSRTNAQTLAPFLSLPLQTGHIRSMLFSLKPSIEIPANVQADTFNRTYSCQQDKRMYSYKYIHTHYYSLTHTHAPTHSSSLAHPNEPCHLHTLSLQLTYKNKHCLSLSLSLTLLHTHSYKSRHGF